MTEAISDTHACHRTDLRSNRNDMLMEMQSPKNVLAGFYMTKSHLHKARSASVEEAQTIVEVSKGETLS